MHKRRTPHTYAATRVSRDRPRRCRYVDYPITDVLQMMGRAGRPQFDRTAKAVIMVHEPKKGFYKKFLYEPFPVESALHEQLPDHLNAEIVNGTIRKAQDAVDYLTWTYLYQRLPQNPAYYGVAGAEEDGEEEGPVEEAEGAAEARVADHISALVEDSLLALQVRHACIRGGRTSRDPLMSRNHHGHNSSVPCSRWCSVRAGGARV